MLEKGGWKFSFGFARANEAFSDLKLELRSRLDLRPTSSQQASSQPTKHFDCIGAVLVGYTYTGAWINWSRGAVFGATITLSNRDAGYLTSFLGVFVTLVGTQCWIILSFMIHQLNAKSRGNALQRQHQIILRNSGSAAGAAWEFITLPFSWRRKTPAGSSSLFPPGNFLIQSWLIALPALLTFAFFSAAGVLSSQISKAVGNEKLIYGPNCGQWLISDQTTDAQHRAWATKVLNESSIAANYARYCYGPVSTSSQCNFYAQQQIKWTAHQNASCPFSGGICVFGDTAALELDTGYVDSHWVLGINSRLKDRMLCRRVTTCAPLEKTGRITNFEVAGAVTYQYDFGSCESSDYTIMYFEDSTSQGLQYFLQDFATGGGWTPIPELNRTDADVSLFAFEPKIVAYLGPVYDPFFAATQQITIGSNAIWQSKDATEYVHWLACTDQHQFRDPNTVNSNTKIPTCTDLTSTGHLYNAINAMNWIARQNATLLRLLLNVEQSQIYYSTAGRGSSALRASEQVFEELSNPLPKNQWMIEVNSLFGISLARLQHGLVEYATGPGPLAVWEMVLQPSDPEGLALCHTQKVREAGGCQSFSVFRLASTLVLGGLIITVSLVLEPVVGFVRQNWTRDPKQKRVHWILDGKLQLLRMSHEYAGTGHWVRTDGQIPVTTDGDHKIFALPHDVDPDEPGWKPSSKKSKTLSDSAIPDKTDSPAPHGSIPEEPMLPSGTMYPAPTSRSPPLAPPQQRRQDQHHQDGRYYYQPVVSVAASGAAAGARVTAGGDFYSHDGLNYGGGSSSISEIGGGRAQQQDSISHDRASARNCWCRESRWGLVRDRM